MRQHLTNDERCMAVVAHHSRITSWHLCQYRRRHAIEVETTPVSLIVKDHKPERLTVHVCGLHARRLEQGHRLDVHDGGWRGHFKNEPTDIPVRKAKGTTDDPADLSGA